MINPTGSLLIIFIFVFLLTSIAWCQPRLALLPFQNLSGFRAASGQLMPSVEKELTKKGYKILQKDLLEKFLQQERIRFLDSLPTPLTQKLTKHFALEAVLVGSILSYGTGENPQVGLSARLISKEGALLWGNTIGLTGEDEMGVFGLGKVQRIEDLVPMAAHRLFETFQLKGRFDLTNRGGPKQLLLSGPRVYRSPSIDLNQTYRVGVLPLENQSTNREAGRILLNLLLLRLAVHKRFEVIEPGDLREGMIVEGIRSFDEMDKVQRKIMARRLNATLFIGGTIYKYSEGLRLAEFSSPEVEFYLSMLDAEKGKIVWTAHHSRKGADYLTVLQFGLIRSPIALADQALEEMISTLTMKPLERQLIPLEDDLMLGY